MALHGLSGHAWKSFASANNSREGIKETCWLRDELPNFLEAQDKGIHPRVMTYGYNANVWVNHTIDGLDTPVSDLIHSLKVEREVRDQFRSACSHFLTGTSRILPDLFFS